MVTQFCPNISYTYNDNAWYKSYSPDLNELNRPRLQVVCFKLLISGNCLFFTLFCQKIIFLFLYVIGYQPDIVLRSCGVLPANVDPCSYMKLFKKIEDCTSCKTDLCNQGSDDKYDPVVNMII